LRFALVHASIAPMIRLAPSLSRRRDGGYGFAERTLFVKDVAPSRGKPWTRA
jgi:hypothetical protein